MTPLKRMHQNPAADRTMHDVEAVCRQHDGQCELPSGGGSHWEVSTPGEVEILTVPAHRPIKPVYIRKLVRFIEAARRRS
ncbi:MAG: type II toxin-antitoxin system HicA family toxin [Gluconacetobacter diazotrophicus]|nr:type II toxin-antitoxin system HicA family toxin [Gluconacetobacter diazotrophicus]